MKMKKTFLAIALGVFVGILGSSGVRAADDQKVKIEKQPLQDGEIEHVNIYNGKGDILRVLVKYKDGKTKTEEYENNARTLVVESDSTGWSRRSEYDSALKKVTETLPSGKKIILLNVDHLGKTNRAKVELSVKDELYLIYTFEPWPGRRTDNITTVKSSGALGSGGSTTPNLPTGKLVPNGAFSAKKVGAEEVKVKTELISAGFPGPHGRPPKATTVEVTVDVIVK